MSKKEDVKNPLLSMEVLKITHGYDDSHDDKDSSSPSRQRLTGRNSDGWKFFTDGLDKYTGVKGQGSAIWVPTEVKKAIESIRAKASTNIPIRSMAAAMIMAFIEEHKKELSKL